MSPRAKKPPKPTKRGPGRPRLNPDGETVPLTIRITQADYVGLRELITKGHGPTMADAIRAAIRYLVKAERLGQVASGRTSSS